MFQSPPASKGGCNQNSIPNNIQNKVSIPTRLERRVQCNWQSSSLCVGSFNPHPPRKAGAMDIYGIMVLSVRGFNPHPPRKAGAILRSNIGACRRLFQSPPASKGGCNDGISHADGERFFVSIPTRLERRVQLRGRVFCFGCYLVSIPTRLERRVQSLENDDLPSSKTFQSPTRLERRVQYAGVSQTIKPTKFQSPPASKGGCNSEMHSNSNY